MQLNRMGLMVSVFFVLVILTIQYDIAILAEGVDEKDNVTNHLGPKQLKQERGYLEITSDQELGQIALMEGWRGNGAEDNPFIIENYSFRNSKLNPQIFQELNSSTQVYYQYGGFTDFDLVINQISLHVNIQNNSFTNSVLVNGSRNVSILNNDWTEASGPFNLFVSFSHNMLVSQNIFDGDNQHCADYPQMKFSPRVVVFGGVVQIHKNLFEIDTGCLPIQQVLVDGGKTLISSNLFKSSDLAINLKQLAGFSGDTLTVHNNHFETGEFAILLSGHTANVYNNNFVESKIGIQGQQTYNQTISFFGNWYRSDTIGIGGVVSGEQNIYSNYYSTWDGPDSDGNGIVDRAFQLGINAFDRSPSTIPFPGYYDEWDLGDDRSNDKGSGPNYVFITASIFSSLVILGLLGSQFYQRVVNSRYIYQGDLNGKPKAIIKEIFKSQTVLYYTLIGQNRIKDSEVEEEVKKAIPTDLFKFKFLFHPVKISITKLLYENLQMTSMEIKDILEISWNDYYTHAYALEKKGYVSIIDEFIEGNKRQVLRLEQVGIEEYKVLIDLLHLFLDNSTDYQAYIEAAQKNIEGIDTDLYPK